MDPSTSQLVIVLDFGAQYSQLIARRIRECHVYCEILPFSTPVDDLLRRAPRAIVLTGGPPSVYEANAPTIDPGLYCAGVPILGICYGMQLMAQQLGGRVAPGGLREYGKTELRVREPEGLFAGLNDHLICWMSHGDRVESPPPGFRALAATPNTPVAAMGDPERRLFGVQFHPEVTHTPWGREVLRNFLLNVAECVPGWTMERYSALATAAIRERVAEGRVICGLSGGVDSAVTAALVHRAVGDQLTCIFVDHGLLRKEEAQTVREAFADHFGIPLVVVDAADRFLARLEGVTDPEEKRRRIGEEFVRVFEAEARRLGEVRYLAQGTLYPDVIESGAAWAGQQAAVIKTHHNVGGLPEAMDLELVEPLRPLFKDEVRALAEELGLPAELTWRHPFPGPGLAIRILGEVTRERLALLREADAILLEEVRRAGLYRELAQVFAVLLPIHSVGVMGDHRTYAHPVVVRAVTSEDFMTADWARLPHDVLDRISRRIVNEVPGVNRVLYDLSSKPPATIEWE